MRNPQNKELNLESFFKANNIRHVNTIKRIVKDYCRAEDIVQQAYERAWRYRDKYDPNRSGVNQWFNKILFNSLRDELKTNQQFEEFGEDICEEDKNTIDPQILLEISLTRNRTHRDVLTKIIVDGWRPKDLEHLLGFSRNNTDKILFRFKERFTLKDVSSIRY